MAETGKGKQPEISVEALLDAILDRAVRDKASDVHIEPMGNSLRVRFRVDGYLREKARYPIEQLSHIITRIKAISNLDLGSHSPQDGHFETRVDLLELDNDSKNGGIVQKAVITDASSSSFWSGLFQQKSSNKKEEEQVTTKTYYLNIRVSMFPTVYGEAAVLRIFNRSDTLIPLRDIGMDDETYQMVHDLITRNYGMTLVTGPAGSGKTTTLYSIIQEVKTDEKNVVTLEDPVEFYFGDVRQCEVRPQSGMTFASGLKAILRQDPDILMIGEIRGHER